MASAQADEETYSLEETILIHKNKFVDWGVFSGERSTGHIFLHGLQDGYLKSQTHVEGEQSTGLLNSPKGSSAFQVLEVVRPAERS